MKKSKYIVMKLKKGYYWGSKSLNEIITPDFDWLFIFIEPLN